MENKNISWKKYLIIFIIASGTTVMYSLPYLKSTFYDPMRAALGLDHQQVWHSGHSSLFPWRLPG